MGRRGGGRLLVLGEEYGEEHAVFVSAKYDGDNNNIYLKSNVHR